jgi:hypothetical protein
MDIGGSLSSPHAAFVPTDRVVDTQQQQNINNAAKHTSSHLTAATAAAAVVVSCQRPYQLPTSAIACVNASCRRLAADLIVRIRHHHHYQCHRRPAGRPIKLIEYLPPHLHLHSFARHSLQRRFHALLLWGLHKSCVTPLYRCDIFISVMGRVCQNCTSRVNV